VKAAGNPQPSAPASCSGICLLDFILQTRVGLILGLLVRIEAALAGLTRLAALLRTIALAWLLALLTTLLTTLLAALLRVLAGGLALARILALARVLGVIAAACCWREMNKAHVLLLVPGWKELP
jgi:hypothetical protein